MRKHKAHFNIMKKRLPHIGARTIKTGLTVLVCSIVSLFILKRDTGFISSISGITCLQNNVENSIANGKNRVIGTIVGALIGFAVMYLCNSIEFIGKSDLSVSIISAFGTIVTIYICILFDLTQCINTACVMFLILVMTIGEENWVTYSVLRTIDTFTGVIIGIIINKYILKSSFKKACQDE